MLRSYRSDDEGALLALNERYVEDLSPMDAARFDHLRRICAVLRVAEHNNEVAGFILCFTPGSAYDSPNYRWFCENLDSFLYIDRVVVSPEFQGSGVGREFYTAARDWSEVAKLKFLVAEINIEPPNEGSLRFHARMGFREMATQRIGPGKVVSLQCLEIG